MKAHGITTTTRPMARLRGLRCDGGTRPSSRLVLVMTMVLAVIIYPQGMMAQGVDTGAVGPRADARSVSTGTLNAFVRALQLSDNTDSPVTAPPTRFRFETTKPKTRTSSRITYIPQDRVERIRKPLLPFPGASFATATTPKPKTQSPTQTQPTFNTRFTTPPAPTNSKPSIDNTFSDGTYVDDYDYYNDYYDYYYFDNETQGQDSPVGNLGPLDPPSQPKELSTQPPKPSTTQPPTTAQTFRFSSSDHDAHPSRRPALPSRRDRPSSGGSNPAGRYSLSELIANLKDQVQGNPDPPLTNSLSNTSNNDRDARVLFENTATASKDPDVNKQVPKNNFEVRITNSTESSVVVASVQTSHSVSVSEGFGPTTKLPPVALLPKTETPETTIEPEPLQTTTRRTLSDIYETVDTAPAVIRGTSSPAPPRQLKRLDDFFPNLNSDITNTEKDGKLPHGLLVKTSTERSPAPPRLETLFNIEIDTKNQTVTATDAKLDSFFDSVSVADIAEFLPPGYNVTDEIQDESTSSSTTTSSTSTSSSTTSSTTSPTTTSTTSKSIVESLFETAITPDISQFLPPGFKLTENPLADPPSTTTTTTTTTTTEKEDLPLTTSEKSNLFNLFSDIQTTSESPTSESSKPSLFDKVSVVDVSSFLPPGFKLPEETEPSEQPSVDNAATSDQPSGPPPTKKIPLVKTVDISSFLSPGYKLSTESPPTEVTTKKASVVPIVDISDFLPPGYNLSENPPVDTSKKLPAVKAVDISAFLPPGYNPDNIPEEEQSPSSSTTTKPETTTTARKFVFPRRPDRPSYLTTPTPSVRTTAGPSRFKPVFKNIWDAVRTTTEFTGWKITTQATPAGGSVPQTKDTTSTSTTTTTTTTTTTIAPRPTTPGVCGMKCRLAATLRIIDGTEWRPELANRDTLEWQELANTVEIELDSLYRRSRIAQYYERVEIDAFSPGSVLVDYILHLTEVPDILDTTDLKEILNREMSDSQDFFLGNYTLDPNSTDFIVMRQREHIKEDNGSGYLIPQWLIAVIVIGLASLLFILIFGITVYVNRTCCNVVKPANVPLTEEMLNECDLVNRARVKKRHDLPLTAEMLNELNKAHMAGVDNYAMDGLYDMDAIWNEKGHDRRAMKPPSSKGRGYNPNYNINIYDSWRTDWSGPYGSSATYAKRRPDTNF